MKRLNSFSSKNIQGLTLIEILIVVAISGMLMVSISSVVGTVTSTKNDIQQTNGLEQEAAFVMRRIVQVISRSNTMEMKKNTVDEIHYDFNIDPQRDMNKDGFADADDDQDGRVDEDDSGDMNGDGASGVLGVDDDGDGSIDEEDPKDDDEDGENDEDKAEIIHFKWKNGIFEQEEKLFDLDESGKIDGGDKLSTIISENITSFVVNTPTQTGRYTLFEISLTLTDASGETYSLSTKVRLGGRL